MNARKLFASVTARYLLMGIGLGLFLPLASLLLEAMVTHLPMTLTTFMALHASHPWLWIIDTAPFFLGFSFGLAGWRLDQIKTLAASLDQQLEAKTTELRRANAQLTQDLEVLSKVEEVVTRGKKEWEAIFDSISDLIFVVDASGSIVRCNRAAAQAFNLSFPQITGRQLTGLLFPADPQAEIRLGMFEISQLERWYEVSASVFELNPGLNRTIYLLHDTSERRRAEEVLENERNLLRTLIDNIPDRVFVKDLEGRKTISNRADCEASGTGNLEAVLGKSDFDLYPPELAAQYWADDRLVLEDGQVILNREEPGRDGQGQLVWVMTTKVPLRDSRGHLIGLVGIGRDITARKQAEAELLREKKFLEALNLTSPAAIVVLDEFDRIVSCNPAFEALYGYVAAEIIGQNLDELITMPETLGEAQAYTQGIKAGAVHGLGKRRRKDGELVTVEIFGAPVMVDGRTVASLAIYHDITELDQARKDAEQANQAKSEFLANMSHEIRTPMNGVIGMLELALDTPLNEEQRDYLNVSLQSAETLLTLINDILDFSKIEAKRLELEIIDFDLRNTVEDVAQMMAKRAEDKGLELICLIHPDLRTGLKGDPARLRQVIVNLVGNAIKFTQQGEIVIRAEPVEENETQAKINFSVQDTGIGIPKDRVAAIFDRFTQADGSTTRKYGGTGLGLTICKQLVEAMGGQIGVDSLPGTGSTFWFTVLLEKQLLTSTQKAAQSFILPVDVTGMRIICIDDNATNRKVISKMVEGFGCRIETAASGPEGLEMLRAAQHADDPFRLVLLDMQMPGMDGEQTAREIKADPALRGSSEVIILTSMGQRGDAARLEALGCAAYLIKPVKQQMLYETLLAVVVRAEHEKPKLVTQHLLSEQKRQDLRILLAEDNPVNQKLAVILLQKAGFSVDAVENGQRALEKVQNDRYNAVLMDVQMPEMDGFEATRLIRHWEITQGRSRIPIIAMTAHALKGDRELCLEAGMDDYVSKPLEPKALFNALDRWTQPSPASGEAAPVEVQDYSGSAGKFSAEIGLDFEDGLFGETAVPLPVVKKPVELLPSTDLPMNLETALPRFFNDRSFFLEMCQDLITHMPDRLHEIHLAWEAKDANALFRQAHNLKGVTANFSADPLSRVAAQIEALGKSEDISPAEGLIRQLEIEARRLSQFCETELGIK
jgi:two-component system sensor histidine kinase/response regulator